MNTKSMNINGNDYLFINQFKNTRNGFAHVSTVLKNGVELNSARVSYLNRTWESYAYQTSMQRCISELIDQKYYRFIEKFKRDNNIARLVKAKREEADAQFEELESIKELREVYAQL